MARERLVVIGNGMAGLRLIDRLGRHAPGRFDVRVVGAEPAPAYNRVLPPRKLMLRDGRLVGALPIGDVAEAPWSLELIRPGEPVQAFRHALTFGRALVPAQRQAA